MTQLKLSAIGNRGDLSELNNQSKKSAFIPEIRVHLRELLVLNCRRQIAVGKLNRPAIKKR